MSYAPEYVVAAMQARVSARLDALCRLTEELGLYERELNQGAKMDELLLARRITDIAQDVATELRVAVDRFPPFNSAHEGFAVLKEEVDELWGHVKAKQGARDAEAMRKEAIQVAAMAMRFVLDVCDGGRGQK